MKLFSFGFLGFRLATAVVGLFFCFEASGQVWQNNVVLDSPNYLLFTWKGDTLTTNEFAPFFEFMGKADSIGAVLLEAQIQFFLKDSFDGVDKLDETMQSTLFVGLDDYASFCALREKRWKIIKE